MHGNAKSGLGVRKTVFMSRQLVVLSTVDVIYIPSTEHQRNNDELIRSL